MALGPDASIAHILMLVDQLEQEGVVSLPTVVGDRALWRKASYSQGGSGNCVEVCAVEGSE